MKSDYIQTLQNQEEKEFDIKKIIFLLLRQWKWFVLFGALGLIAAYGYNKLTNPKYSVYTSILIPQETDGLGIGNMFKGFIDKPQNNVYNQVVLISSYSNISQTLINLNWRTSWFEKKFFIWKGIYKQEPFDVQETQNFVNLKGIPVYITHTSNDDYTVSVNGVIYQNGVKTAVKFEGRGTFGHPFTNKFFNFTLLKKVNNFESTIGKYYFVFNDLNDVTLTYESRLNAGLKDKKSDIIGCSIVGEEPERESDFLNELIKVYITGKMNIQSESQRRSLDFINTQLTGITDSLNIASAKFTDFRSRNQIVDLGAEGKLVMDNLQLIEKERAQSQLQLDYFQNLLKYLDNNSDLKQLVSPSVVGIQDVSLNALVMKLGELYNRRQVLSFSAKENNPTLIMIDKEINQIRNQLNENLRNLIDNATRNINSQKERQSTISVQLNRLPQKEQKMVNIQRQFNLTNEIYTFLLQKRAETNIALASNMPDAQVIDIARPETAGIIGLAPKMKLILGLLLGLALPMTLILIRNFFDSRIRAQEDIENHTNLPILGSILHSPIKSELTVFEDPKSNVAESFRSLRTNLQFMLNGTGGKVISIHSCNPGEGKSFIAINAGTILAMNNNKVLLIGADLRKPIIHKKFNLENDHGLSSYLIGEDTLEQIIFPTVINNLSVLTSGPIPPNPAELLSKPEMKILIDQLRKIYNYIIIDNAPVGLVTDGFILSSLVDLNIFILRYGVSHKHQVDMINQYASKEMISNPAILVNDIKLDAFGSSYYKNYQYEAYQNTYYSADEKKSKKKSKKNSTI
jgi:capsular exopolysaccharide synthesis family protein